MRATPCVTLFSFAIVAGCFAQPAWSAIPPGSIELERDTYADQLEGFWLAQCIANWTGLQTEGRRIEPPFYTDSDWPFTFDGRQLRFVTDQDPWRSDDDTDIEYVYAELIAQYANPMLSASEIRNGWVEHINNFIWVSNRQARTLMDRGVTPPATSLPSANGDYLKIDAQLTTEFFGTLAPGMPARALELADLPIATTARSHAAHAAQFFVVLHSLAAVRGQSALNPEGIEQLVVDARAYLPDTSKAADIVDTVLADYRANIDKHHWERTRDLVASRYQLNADANGFKYLAWFESSVNFGSALVCLLYGQGDLHETIRIGTLSGWDSDNPTATMGGLIGLMLGADAVREEFQGTSLSDRYLISSTRDGMHDYLPDDLGAEDRFSLLAQRQLFAVDQGVESGGGVVHPTRWLIPPHVTPDPDRDNPMVCEGKRSANFNAHESGTPPTASTSLVSVPVSNPGSPSPSRFANGIEYDPSGRDNLSTVQNAYFWTRGAAPDANGEVTLQVQYAQPVDAHTLRFIEGDHFSDGGWFETLYFEIHSGGQWIRVNPRTALPLDPAIPFQILEYQLDPPRVIDAVRVRGRAGGSAQFVTATEIDVLTVPAARPIHGWDINRDLRFDIEDLYAFPSDPIDINQDGMIDRLDAKLLEGAMRWREREVITISP